MSTRYLGFLGIKLNDMMFYLSRVCHVLGNKVLIVDVSPDKNYILTVPPLAKDVELFDYRGVDVTQHPSSDEIKYDEYDYVLTNFGTDMKHKALPQMDEIYMVTDLQLSNTKLFDDLNILDYQQRFLVIRDVIPGNNLTMITVENFLSKGIREGSVFPIFLDNTDIELSLECLYKDRCKFTKLSKDFYYFLYTILSVDYNEKVFKAAFRKAAGGK